MDKKSVEYFMTKMTQEEFDEIRGDVLIEPYVFNRIQPERSKREDSYSVEFGSDTGISFLTSEGIKKLEPGKKYDKNLNEI